jgi:hypothetical protein
MKTIKILSFVLLFTSTTAFSGVVKQWGFFENPLWEENLNPTNAAKGTTSFEVMFISDNSSYSCVAAVSSNMANCGKQMAKDCYAITKEPEYKSERLGFKETFAKGQGVSAMDIYDSSNNQLCMITVGSSGMAGMCAHFDVKCINVGSTPNPVVQGAK